MVKSLLCGNRRQLHAGLGVKLVEQRGDVGLDGVGRDVERLRYGLVRTPFGHQSEYLPLPRTQPVGLRRATLPRGKRLPGSGLAVLQFGQHLVQQRSDGTRTGSGLRCRRGRCPQCCPGLYCRADEQRCHLAGCSRSRSVCDLTSAPLAPAMSLSSSDRCLLALRGPRAISRPIIFVMPPSCAPLRDKGVGPRHGSNSAYLYRKHFSRKQYATMV